jgi:PKD repeat protein
VKGVNGCGNGTSSSINVVVNYAPIASFTQNVTDLSVSFNNTSSYGTSYLWNFDDGATSTEQNPSHSYAQNGVYHVSLVVTNLCGSDSVNVPITISVVSVPEENESNAVILYPSPAKDRIYLKIGTRIEGTPDYVLYNNVGQVIQQGGLSFNNGDNTAQISIDNLSVGYYFIKLSFVSKPIKLVKI